MRKCTSSRGRGAVKPVRRLSIFKAWMALASRCPGITCGASRGFAGLGVRLAQSADRCPLRRQHRDEYAAGRTLGDRQPLIEPLLCLHDQNASEEGPEPPPHTLQRQTGTHHPAARGGWKIQGVAHRADRKVRFAQQGRKLGPAIGASTAEGVCSKRAQTPRRFGTTMTRRPLGARTRHISFSVSVGFSAYSSACTIRMRSMDESGRGNSSSNTSAVDGFSIEGQATAPDLRA